MIEQGDWGPVHVIAGQHKGKTGYYDDDDTDRTAIVYFGVPFESAFVLIQRRYLEKADNHLPSEKFTRSNPIIAHLSGVVTRRRS